MQQNIDKTIWRRVGLIAILLPICIFIPFLLLLVGLIAWGIYSDLKAPEHPHIPPQPTWRDATPENRDWLAQFCQGCESPAEEKFLRAMVAEYALKPNSGKLVSQKLTLEMQVTFENYRFDFLANGSHVIEIDGAAYHSAPEQIERDRIRDERSVQGGYKVLRIPASVIFSAPDEAIRRVRAALAETPVYAKPQRVQPAVIKKSISQHVDAFFETWDEISKKAEAERRLAPIMAEFRVAIKLEQDIFDNLVRDAELDKKMDSMTADERERYLDDPFEGEIQRSFLRKIPQYHGSYSWKEIIRPSPIEDYDLQLTADVEYQRTMEARDERLNKLKKRCEDDEMFMNCLRKKMVEAGCPNEVATRIVSII